MPGFNIGSDDNECQVFVQPNGQTASRAPPKKLYPTEYHQSLTQSKDKVIISEKQIMKLRLFEKKNELGREIPAFFLEILIIITFQLSVRNQITNS